MKVTNFGTAGFPIALAGWSTGEYSVNSNFNTTDGGLSAVNFVQRITSNGSNILTNPAINFAAGSNIYLSLDTGAGGSIPSNTIRIHSLTGVGPIITSNGSNSLAAVVNLQAGSGIALGVAGSTITITNTGVGAASSAAVDPVANTFGTPDTAYEFETASLTGLTAIGSPTTENANTTVPSALYYKDSSAGIAWMGRYQASPAMPFTAMVKILDHSSFANFNHGGLLVGVADPTTGTLMIPQVGLLTRQFIVSKYTNRTTFSSNVYTGGTGFGTPFWIAAVVNSTTSIDYYYSMNGWLWMKALAAHNPSMTVGSVGLVMSSENAGGFSIAFDYLRIWNSAKTFI